MVCEAAACSQTHLDRGSSRGKKEEMNKAESQCKYLKSKNGTRTGKWGPGGLMLSLC